MKKIILVMIAALCVSAVSAQNSFESSVKQAAKTIASQRWSAGVRLGTSADINAECFYSGNKYFEGVFGVNYADKHHLGVDFTILHNWNCYSWDWTPKAGLWFLDCGAGINIGGHANRFWWGVAGQAKFGIKFAKAPIRLAVNITPVFGPCIDYGKIVVETPVFDENGQQTNSIKDTYKYRYSNFRYIGLASATISATYCF